MNRRRPTRILTLELLEERNPPSDTLNAILASLPFWSTALSADSILISAPPKLTWRLRPRSRPWTNLCRQLS
jgi:hypothetical protein